MSDERSPRKYQRGRWAVAENVVMSALARAGVVPNTYLMTTKGRKTGKQRSNPVTIVELDKRRWLVAPYGAVPWVLNARAAGEVRLTRGWDSRRFALRPASPVEAGPVLKRYVSIAAATRDYFRAGPDAPADDFIAEADDHPVFELIEIKPAVTPN